MSSRRSESSRTGRELATSQVARVKRFHSKSRKGCFTCRQRRVKCDEQRTPNCTRCDKGGYICEWQDAPRDKSEDRLSLRAVRSSSQATTRSDDENAASHRFFSEGVVVTIAGLFTELAESFITDSTTAQNVTNHISQFYYQILFQASRSSPILQKTLTAICGLHDCVCSGTGIALSFTDHIASYGEAVTDVRHSTERLPPDIILIACVLFANCEYLMGDLCSAVKHLRAGANILNEHKFRPNPRLSTEIIETLEIILNAFDHDSLLVSNTTAQESWVDTTSAMQFFDLAEANENLTQIYHHVFAMKNVSRSYPRHSQTMIEDLSTWLETWSRRISDLEIHVPFEHNTWLQLLMFQHSILSDIMARSSSNGARFRHSVLGFDNYSVSNIAEMVSDVTLEGEEFDQPLTGHIGVILPLFITILHHSDRLMCRTALDNLRQLHVTEGVWNSCLVYEIASFILRSREDVSISAGLLSSPYQEEFPAAHIANIAVRGNGQELDVRVKFVKRGILGLDDIRAATLTEFCTDRATDAPKLQEIILSEGYQGRIITKRRAPCFCHV